MKKRFIIIVLDGFGIGAMDDARIVRPGDEKANTLKSILKDYPDLKLPNLEKLGLMNAYGMESASMKFSAEANFGSCELLHYGADTFMGHQEIMGTLPQKPEIHPFQEKVDELKAYLEANGHNVRIIDRQSLRYLLVDHYVTVADNLEADLGLCYNVTAPLDFISFEEEYAIARKVREVVTVGRVIVFGGKGNTMEDIWNAEEVKQDRFIGIASSKSKSYDHGYQCRHLGYGVDQNVQVPTILTNAGYSCTLIGKVADIVTNDKGVSISCVPTKEVMDLTIRETKALTQGFLCTNVQETDLAGHSQSSKIYKEILETADRGIGELLPELTPQDILVVMADHGNDPDIGHSKHTRECVPLLIYKKGITGRSIGRRKSLSDAGASACAYFDTVKPQNGESFLTILKDYSTVTDLARFLG